MGAVQPHRPTVLQNYKFRYNAIGEFKTSISPIQLNPIFLFFRFSVTRLFFFDGIPDFFSRFFLSLQVLAHCFKNNLEIIVVLFFHRFNFFL